MVTIIFCLEMKSDLESEGKGPDRNSADYRIKKAQVIAYIQVICDVAIYGGHRKPLDPVLIATH